MALSAPSCFSLNWSHHFESLLGGVTGSIKSLYRTWPNNLPVDSFCHALFESSALRSLVDPTSARWRPTNCSNFKAPIR